MRSKTKKLTFALTGLGALSMTLALGSNARPFDFSQIKMRSETMQFLDNNGKFASDFTTLADTQAAAADLNEQISLEGNTLLKNDGTLPLEKGAFVSIFGESQLSVVGTSNASKETSDRIKTPAESLEAAGYKVNHTLLSYYEDHKPASSGGFGGFGGVQGTYGQEETKFNSNVTNSLGIYDDCGIVFLSRAGGEGSDLDMTIDEESDEGEHVNEISGKKHYLELTDEEQDLIELAKKTCDKVVIVLNTSNVMEIGGLKDDDLINAILWVGRPGESGMKALGQLMSGEYNFSGRTVDTWARDFSKDPTWFNFGDNSQIGREDSNMYYYHDGTAAGSLNNSGGPGSGGFYGVDYEEGIYMGYRYYETRYYEMVKKLGADKANQWYEANIAYPFGYGIGYSTFSFEMGGLFTDSKLETPLGNEVEAATFASSLGHEAGVKTLFVPVTVTNTGSVTGKQTVQVYVTAPYKKGGVEKSFVKLVGYGKTGMLKPGAKETVIVEVQVQDMASFDEDDKNKDDNKGYELDIGTYVIRAMDSSHVKLNDDLSHAEEDRPYAEASFTIKGDKPVDLKIDDYSGKEVSPKLVGEYTTIRNGFNQTDADPMTLLKRDDLGTDVDISKYEKSDASTKTATNSFPRPQTTAGRTFNADFWNSVFTMELYDADNTADYAKYDAKGGDDAKGWAIDNTDIPSDWTQAATTAESNTTKLKDMAGKPLRDKDGNITQDWTKFMNQLSWEEIQRVVSNGGYCTADVDSVDKIEGFDLDDPLDLDNSYGWTDQPTVAATFNVELGRKQGIITANLGMFKRTDGWYGPGMNTHRSPFGGRNCQYYSEDPMCAGIMAAAVVKGAQSRGLNCIVKHLALNEQETNRAGDCLFNWASEQSIREIYLKPFQMALQEGGASGAMTACVRIGMMSASADYAMNYEICHEEWDWDGFLLTDGYTGVERPNPVDLMVRTSNDLPLGNVKGGTGIGPNTYDSVNVTVYDKESTADNHKLTVKRDDKISGTWNSTLRSGKGGVNVGGVAIEAYDKATHSVVTKTFETKESPVQYYNARMIATRVLYTAANSQTNHNGIKMVRDSKSEDVWVDWGKSGSLGTIAQGSESTFSLAPADGVLQNDTITSYTITSGELPEGLTLNDDGTITGKVTAKAGTYKFSVKMTADYWNSATAEFSITVSTVFEFKGDDTTKAKVGNDFEGYVTSDVIKDSDDGKTKVSYSISEGELPDGLTIGEEGLISGKPTKAGTFTFTVKASEKVTKQSSGGGMGPGMGGPGGGFPGMGGGSSTTTTDYYFTMTITVEEGEVEEPTDYDAEIAAIKAQIEELANKGVDTSAIEARIKALEDKTTDSDITSLKSDIAALKTQIEDLKNNTKASSSGCSGSVIAATSSVAAITLLGAGLLLKKKKEEK